ncbi:MAG: putative hydrolase [Candidatus Atribacteria bacterium]|nr:putative hydrolase [Rikenellaceae bacterium]MDI3530201.1 putative hydrolase [Candidatus Atribacteria bacterium]
MHIVGDLHVHTLASGHAYSTVLENVQVAKRKGLKVLGIADHGPSMPGGPDPLYFEARGHFPREVNGCRIFFGVEVDILDFEGNLDLEEKVLRKVDYAIAAFHPQVFKGGNREDNTKALLRVLKNPLVNIIAHPGNPRYPLDYERIVEEAVSNDKIIEINNSSFSVSRKGSLENCRLIAVEVMKRGGTIILSSDAHFCEEVGDFSFALAMLKEIGFPEDKVVNADLGRLEAFLEKSIKDRR